MIGTAPERTGQGRPGEQTTMGHASSGGACPLCGRYASRRTDGRLYVHKGTVRHLIGAGYQECRASTQTLKTAYVMRANLDAGRNPSRNGDGTWIKLY